MAYWHQVIESWRLELSRAEFKNRAIRISIFLVAALAVYSWFVNWIENRAGSILEDPLLMTFDPVDLSWMTFFLIYSGLVLALVYLIHTPSVLLSAMKAYAVMVSIRMVAMWCLPLDPPLTMITLGDPFVEVFGTGKTLTKDLFFSGHTATMFLISLAVPHPFLKRLYLGLTIVIGLCVILQHVHYSIDVLAAPFFAYGAYRLSNRS